MFDNLSALSSSDTGNTVYDFVNDVTGNETAADVASWILAKPLAIVILIVVGLVARWILHRVLERVTSRAGKGTPVGVPFRRNGDDESDPQSKIAAKRREQRAKTLGSVLKSITSGVIFSVLTFMIISELGYNIAPLIASAGIVGVAIAFGAQSLVSDFVTGTFMMLEDQYGVGDEVDLGEAIGTVEAVTLRMTRLRDINGTVWYVRNGQITRVGNSSQNWARSVLDVPVSYDADLGQVRAVLHDVARALWQNPEWNGQVLEEPEVWGVERWDPDAIVLRVVLKTAPSKQWAVAREMRELITDRFDSLGIQIPLPQRVLHIKRDDLDPVAPDAAPAPLDPAPTRAATTAADATPGEPTPSDDA